MIVIISSEGNTIDSPVNERFGRCPNLIKINTNTMAWEAFENPGLGRTGGAGVAAAQLVIDQKADLVISGDFGPNAYNALISAGINMHLFKEKDITVRQAIESLTVGK